MFRYALATALKIASMLSGKQKKIERVIRESMKGWTMVSLQLPKPS